MCYSKFNMVYIFNKFFNINIIFEHKLLKSIKQKKKENMTIGEM